FTILLTRRRPLRSTLFPYTTLFRSYDFMIPSLRQQVLYCESENRRLFIGIVVVPDIAIPNLSEHAQYIQVFTENNDYIAVATFDDSDPPRPNTWRPDPDAHDAAAFRALQSQVTDLEARVAALEATSAATA